MEDARPRCGHRCVAWGAEGVEASAPCQPARAGGTRWAATRRRRRRWRSAALAGGLSVGCLHLVADGPTPPLPLPCAAAARRPHTPPATMTHHFVQPSPSLLLPLPSPFLGLSSSALTCRPQLVVPARPLRRCPGLPPPLHPPPRPPPPPPPPPSPYHRRLLRRPPLPSSCRPPAVCPCPSPSLWPPLPLSSAPPPPLPPLPDREQRRRSSVASGSGGRRSSRHASSPVHPTPLTATHPPPPAPPQPLPHPFALWPWMSLRLLPSLPLLLLLRIRIPPTWPSWRPLPWRGAEGEAAAIGRRRSEQRTQASQPTQRPRPERTAEQRPRPMFIRSNAHLIHNTQESRGPGLDDDSHRTGPPLIGGS